MKFQVFSPQFHPNPCPNFPEIGISFRGCCCVGRQDLPPNNAMRNALGEAEKLRKQSGDSTSVTD